MSHHNSINGKQPTKVDYRVTNLDQTDELDQISSFIPVDKKSKKLLIPGQGTIVFAIPDPSKNATAYIDFVSDTGDTVRLDITETTAAFLYKKDKTDKFQIVQAINKGEEKITPPDGYGSGIDKNQNCIYWVSIDSLNKILRYGKGEMRASTVLLDYKYDKPKTLFDQKTNQEYAFINDLKYVVSSSNITFTTQWKDPVVSEPPVLVVPSTRLTMDAAAAGLQTTPASLSPECQILYGSVADFELNTPDFPDFAQAIEYSLRTPNHIAHTILSKKLSEGEFHPDPDNPYKEVYLRITLGNSQGESPGIPYVMEIWPAGCASPVHHHGYTHAIIKVLHGGIDVDVYRMLPSASSSKKALKTVKFDKGDVTYLMPEVNQYHLLKNDLNNTDTCITIQCYSYSQNDDIHYATFDYVEHEELGHFDPISDYDYTEFKETIRQEWQTYLRTKFWLEEQ